MFGRKTRARLDRLERQVDNLRFDTPLQIQNSERRSRDLVYDVEARLNRLEPAVFPEAARKRLAAQVRYVGKGMTDKELTKLFRHPKDI